MSDRAAYDAIIRAAKEHSDGTMAGAFVLIGHVCLNLGAAILQMQGRTHQEATEEVQAYVREVHSAMEAAGSRPLAVYVAAGGSMIGAAGEEWVRQMKARDP